MCLLLVLSGEGDAREGGSLVAGVSCGEVDGPVVCLRWRVVVDG